MGLRRMLLPARLKLEPAHVAAMKYVSPYL
jgi:hypothetical protein